jgi:hypothetical protein
MARFSILCIATTTTASLYIPVPLLQRWTKYSAINQIIPHFTYLKPRENKSHDLHKKSHLPSHFQARATPEAVAVSLLIHLISSQYSKNFINQYEKYKRDQCAFWIPGSNQTIERRRPARKIHLPCCLRYLRHAVCSKTSCVTFSSNTSILRHIEVGQTFAARTHKSFRWVLAYKPQLPIVTSAGHGL